MAGERAKRTLAALKRQGQTTAAVYRPGRSSLAARTIDVLIEAADPAAVMNGRAPRFRFSVLNDEVLGIPADPTLSDAGTDRIDLAERLGGPTTTRQIKRYGDHDADWMAVEAQ